MPSFPAGRGAALGICKYRIYMHLGNPPITREPGEQGRRFNMGENHARIEYITDGKKIGMSVLNFNTPGELKEFRERVADVHRSMMSDEKTVLIKDVKKA
jgi:hypothetical protein